jgi:hypothetical protein
VVSERRESKRERAWHGVDCQRSVDWAGQGRNALLKETDGGKEASKQTAAVTTMERELKEETKRCGADTEWIAERGRGGLGTASPVFGGRVLTRQDGCQPAPSISIDSD